MIPLATSPLPERIGPYHVTTRLASGGMAELFLAVRRGVAGFERPVVVKRMLPHLATDPELCAAIVDEARIMARLRHPNVASVDELGIDGESYFLVLEYLRGDSVSALLRRLRARGERLEPALAAYVVGETCAGLHAAHELADDDGSPLGVVHRDVSPQNVFITFDGEVKVIDFGIARFSHRASARTKTGIAKGKFAYMAPEQFTGDPLDRRADVFAVGALMHELLTGDRLFARDSDMQVLKAILQDPIVPPSERWPAIPASLDGVCLRALARARDERFATADALRTAVRELMPVVDPGQHARDRLVALMRRVLADRWAESEDLLRRSRERSSTRPNPTRLHGENDVTRTKKAEPAVEELDSLQISVVAPSGPPPAADPDALAPDASTPALPRLPGERRRRAGRPLIALAAAAAVALAVLVPTVTMRPGGITGPASAGPLETGSLESGSLETGPLETGSLESGSSPRVPLETPPVQAAPLEIPPAEASPPTVRVQIETTPTGAEVRAGDRVLGATPLDVELPRSSAPLELTITRPGFLPAHETIVPASDASLRIQLDRAREEPRPRRRDPRFYKL